MKSRALLPGALLIITLIALGAVLKLTADILLPLAVALLLSFVLAPVMDFMVRFRIPRKAAVGLIIVGLLGVGFLTGLVIYSSISSLVGALPAYQSRLLNLIRIGLERLRIPSNILSEPSVVRSIEGYAFGFFGSFVRFLGSLLLVQIFLVVMLLERRYLRRKLFRALGKEGGGRVLRIVRQMSREIRRYLTTKIVVSLAVGFTTWAAFRIIGLDFAFVWAVLSFMFNFVPAFGSLIIGIVSVIFSVVQYYPDWNPVIAVAATVVFVQIAYGSILEPKVLGDNLNLSPLVILLSLLVWGWLWGLMGLLLAVPLVAAMKITFERVPSLSYLAIIMGTGRRPRGP